MKIFLIILFSLFIVLAVSTIIILNQKQFGKAPSGDRLERIKKSPNYRDGSFQNQSLTPVMAEGKNYFQVAKETMFAKRVKVSPVDSIPFVKTDLFHLDRNMDVLVWFGHSSYFMQIDGKRMLVDPVLSGHASPFSFSVKAFKGADHYKAEHIPDIDYLIITHDHWDHLDYKTLIELKPRIKKVICGLGVGENFEYWGFDKNIITELDWHEKTTPDSGFVLNALPARHFTGRGFKRNQTLWVSYLLQTPTMKIFIGGDGGYDKHFAEIGNKFGPIDLAILENGQYNENWKYIHLLPSDLIKAFNDLNARRLLPIHSSKFALSLHPWDEPLKKIAASSKRLNISLLTPMIGEIVFLKNKAQQFTEWWKGIE